MKKKLEKKKCGCGLIVSNDTNTNYDFLCSTLKSGLNNVELTQLIINKYFESSTTFENADKIIRDF
ncbi:hypothetical protein [Paenimyroides ummariense]|uniref:hypothetical protein n=1 Tax=Paenimyroides ummariense TaxID=913024 RepID=UPI001FE1EAB5|nr:hypothetical protein [Paenimyroides ummariense]